LSFHAQELDDDARNRTHSNPMRVLDSKNPAVQEILKGAPALVDYVSDESIAHYSELKSLLSQVGIEFIESPRLVRGLDYYNNCVFEWTTDSLGAQGTVCGGGRYDGLVEQLGGKATVAAGFAMGVERLVLMLDSLGKVPEANAKVIDVYMVVVGGHLAGPAALLAKQLRQRFPEIGLISHCGGGKYSNQMKRAFNSGARLAIVLDTESEQPLETVKIRQLNDSGDSVSVEIANCSDKLAEFLSISE
jgi:histidyl-tRNA synthetase